MDFLIERLHFVNFSHNQYGCDYGIISGKQLKSTVYDDHENSRGIFNLNAISGWNKNYDNIKNQLSRFFIYIKAGQGITLEISHGGAFDFNPIRRTDKQKFMNITLISITHFTKLIVY